MSPLAELAEHGHQLLVRNCYSEVHGVFLLKVEYLSRVCQRRLVCVCVGCRVVLQWLCPGKSEEWEKLIHSLEGLFPFQSVGGSHDRNCHGNITGWSGRHCLHLSLTFVVAVLR